MSDQALDVIPRSFAPLVMMASPALQSVALFLLAALGFLALGSLSSAVLVRLIASRVSRWEAATRHRAVVLLAALPVLTSMTFLLSASLPAFMSLAFPGLDHCARHEDGHAHLCFVHHPHAGVSILFALSMVFVIAYALLRGLFATSSICRALGALRTLARSGEERQDLGATIIETARPVCLAAGLFRPRVLLSRGLLTGLSSQERAVILAHEQAHVRRRDALRATMVRALLLTHLPVIARWLERELEIAAEQACDEEAAGALGDQVVDARMAVASAILTVERAIEESAAKRASPLAPALAFAERAIERRVESLLAAPAMPATRSLRLLVACLAGAALAVMGLSGQLHHVTESLLSTIIL